MEFRIVDESHIRNHPVRPEAILAAGFSSTFGKYEVEETAENLVRFCQEKGGWKQFTISELHNFYVRNKLNPDKMFFGLIGGWFDDAMLFGGWRDARPFLAFDYQGNCYITNLFIEYCAKNVS